MRGFGGRVDTLIERRAKVTGLGQVELVRILAGAGANLRGEEAQDQSVLVRGPHSAVAPNEGGACALLSAERQRAVDQPGAEPLEADGNLEKAAAKFGDQPVDHAAGNDRLADRAVGTPFRSVRAKVGDGGRQEGVGIHQPRGWANNAVAVRVCVIGEGDIEAVPHGDQRGHRLG